MAQQQYHVRILPGSEPLLPANDISIYRLGDTIVSTFLLRTPSSALGLQVAMTPSATSFIAQIADQLASDLPPLKALLSDPNPQLPLDKTPLTRLDLIATPIPSALIAASHMSEADIVYIMFSCPNPFAAVKTDLTRPDIIPALASVTMPLKLFAYWVQGIQSSENSNA
jgi:hypothetical protein